MKSCVFLFLISSLLYIGCSDTTEPSETTELIPLKVGNQWILENFHSPGSGLPDETTYDTLQIVGTTQSGDITYYNFTNNSSKDTSYIYQKGNDYYSLDGSRIDYGYTYPAEVGKVNYRDTLYWPGDTVIVTYFLAEKDHPVSVPAGTFTCYKYQVDYRYTNDGSLYRQNFSYIAPGIGPISDETYFPVVGGSMRLSDRSRLMSYTLKP